MNGAYRLSLQHAREIGQVIAHLKGRLGVPVWLVGTSSSSLSIVNVAARLPVEDLPGPDGIITTSSMTELTPYCGKTVFEASLSAIRRPVLDRLAPRRRLRVQPRLRRLGQQVPRRTDQRLPKGAQGFHRRTCAGVRSLSARARRTASTASRSGW